MPHTYHKGNYNVVNQVSSGIRNYNDLSYSSDFHDIRNGDTERCREMSSKD